MDEITRQQLTNERADEILKPLGKTIETMSASEYRLVMAQLRKEHRI